MHAFCTDEPITDVLERATPERSSLTAFFNYNRFHTDEQPSKHHTIPPIHGCLKRERQWKLRQRGYTRYTVGRLFFVHPTSTAGELFYLWSFLLSVSDPKSFEDLRTVVNVVHPTFKAACNTLDLLEDDRE